MLQNMASQHLPLEIKHEILSYLHYERPKYIPRDTDEPLAVHDAQRATLWALTLTDRLWNNLATPLLYESFIPTLYSLPFLLRTLLARPELGQYTTSLGLYDEPHRLIRDPWEMVDWTNDTVETATEKIRTAVNDGKRFAAEASEPFGFVVSMREVKYDRQGQLDQIDGIFFSEEPWIWAFAVGLYLFIREVCLDANQLVYQLFYYLPNLEHLDLNVDESYSLPEVILFEWLHPEFYKEGSSAPICLSRLKWIARMRTENEYDREGGLKVTAFLSSILCLPHLQFIGLEYAYFDSYGILTGPFVKRLLENEDHEVLKENGYKPIKYKSSLEVLDWSMVQFEADSIELIFRRSPQLRVVNMVIGPGPRLEQDNLTMNIDPHCIDTFAKAFRHLKNSLESLKIVVSSEHREYFYLGGDGSDSCGWIGDLSHFSRLRRVELDWQFWSLPIGLRHTDGLPAVSWRFLPERLEYLKIQGQRRDGEILDPNTEGWGYEGKYERATNAHMVPTFLKNTYLDVEEDEEEEAEWWEENVYTY